MAFNRIRDRDVVRNLKRAEGGGSPQEYWWRGFRRRLGGWSNAAHLKQLASPPGATSTMAYGMNHDGDAARMASFRLQCTPLCGRRGVTPSGTESLVPGRESVGGNASPNRAGVGGFQLWIVNRNVVLRALRPAPRSLAAAPEPSLGSRPRHGQSTSIRSES